MTKNLTHAQVIKALDRVFTPDVRLIVDKDYTIIHLKTLTPAGKKTIRHPEYFTNTSADTLEELYPGLCWEYIEPDSFDLVPTDAQLCLF